MVGCAAAVPPAGKPQLFTREDGRVVPASPADIAVAERYAGWSDKGPISGGRRLTLMASSTHYRVGAEVRVIHVLEATDSGVPLYVMGPKPVYNEFVDGQLATRALPRDADPFSPDSYDGRVLTGPGLDFNWDITTYGFDQPGPHRIEWRLGDVHSNTLTVTIG
jgi:hypothetical protein